MGYWPFGSNKGAKVKWSEALSIASSIATLTGVSLAGMSKLGGFEDAGMVEIGFKGVSAIVCVLFAIGALYGVVQGFSWGLAITKDQYRPYMWTFGLAIAVLVASAALGLLSLIASFYWEVHYSR